MNHKKNERKIYMNCKEPIIENMQNMGTLRTTEGDAWQPIKVLNKEFYDGGDEGGWNQRHVIE